MRTYADRVRFVGRGHPNIRATHAKTFELTHASDITQRATCVIAIEVRTDDGRPLAGPVQLTVRVADQPPFAIRARAHSGWLPGSTAIFRRSPMQLPDTYATCADAAAADFPRALAEAARSADAVVTVDVEPAPAEHHTVVLFAADPTRPNDERLRAEFAAADRVVCEDPGARQLADPPPAGDGHRTLVVATRELPGTTVLAALADLNCKVEVVGLPAQLAAAAASPSRAPLVIGAGRPASALRSARAQHRLLLRCTAAEVRALLELAGELRPDSIVALTQQYAPPLRVRAGDPAELPTEDVTYCCFAPAPDAGERAIDNADPAVTAAIRGLLADGVTTRTAASALAELTGMSRRAAYERVLQLGAPQPDS